MERGFEGSEPSCKDREMSVARTSKWPGHIMGTIKPYFSLEDSACSACFLRVNVRQLFEATRLIER